MRRILLNNKHEFWYHRLRIHNIELEENNKDKIINNENIMISTKLREDNYDNRTDSKRI